MPDETRERLTYTQADVDAAVQAEYENQRRPLLVIARELRDISRQLSGVVLTIEEEWRKAPGEMPTMDERRAASALASSTEVPRG